MRTVQLHPFSLLAGSALTLIAVVAMGQQVVPKSPTDSLELKTLVITDAKGRPRFVLEGDKGRGHAEFSVRDDQGIKRLSLHTSGDRDRREAEFRCSDRDGTPRITIGSTDVYTGAFFGDGDETVRIGIDATSGQVTAYGEDKLPSKTFP